MSRRLLGTAAAAGALLLALTGCVDPNEPTVTSMPPTYTVPAKSDGGGETPSDGGGEQPSGGGGESEKPTQAAPDIPAPDPADYAGMDEHTPEGAEQAFRFFISSLYWAYQTGDIEAINEMKGDSCKSCEEALSYVSSLKESGFWSETTLEPFDSVSTDSTTFDHEIGYIFTVSAHSVPSVDGGEVEFQADHFTAQGGLDWIDGKWVVSEFRLQETQSES